jgi:hypothetical protein
MTNEFPGAVPEIPVSDISKAAAYYESNLASLQIGVVKRAGSLESRKGIAGCS